MNKVIISILVFISMFSTISIYAQIDSEICSNLLYELKWNVEKKEQIRFSSSAKRSNTKYKNIKNLVCEQVHELHNQYNSNYYFYKFTFRERLKDDGSLDYKLIDSRVLTNFAYSHGKRTNKVLVMSGSICTKLLSSELMFNSEARYKLYSNYISENSVARTISPLYVEPGLGTIPDFTVWYSDKIEDKEYQHFYYHCQVHNSLQKEQN